MFTYIYIYFIHLQCNWRIFQPAMRRTDDAKIQNTVQSISHSVQSIIQFVFTEAGQQPG